MDLGDWPIWPVILADRLDQLILLWHTHRVGLCAAIVPVVVLLVLRAGTKKLPFPLSNPYPASKEKTSWPEESETQREWKPFTETQEQEQEQDQGPRQLLSSVRRSRVSGPRVI